MKICGIYKIVSPSGRIYIGQSINTEGGLNTITFVDVLETVN